MLLISKMELFTKIVSAFRPFSIFTKSSIFDVCSLLSLCAKGADIKYLGGGLEGFSIFFEKISWPS